MKLGRHEAYQVQYFRERGLRVGIGDMFAMGVPPSDLCFGSNAELG